MLEEILKLDHQLFETINSGLSNVIFDWLMPILRNKYTWIPLYLAIIIYAIKTYKRNGIYLILALALTVGIADFGSASILKPYFNRLRPCNEPSFKEQVISRVPCGSGKSFPSTHASDHFAIAFFLIPFFHKKWKYFSAIAIFWALSICFAQVYVGVHFPVDVSVGALIGGLIGFGCATLFLRYIPNLADNK